MKYIIKWNIGYGESAEVVEAENEGDANMMAYEMWKDEAESSAEYGAELYTQEEAENYGIEE